MSVDVLFKKKKQAIIMATGIFLLLFVAVEAQSVSKIMHGWKWKGNPLSFEYCFLFAKIIPISI